MLAQSLVEYSLVASVSSTFQRARYSLEAWVGSWSSTEWAVAGAAIVLVLAVRTLRRSR